MESTNSPNEDAFIANGEQQPIRISSARFEDDLVNVIVNVSRLWSKTVGKWVMFQLLKRIAEGIGPSVIVIYNPFGVPAREVMLPQLLKTAGYSTHAVGKWHLGACDNRYEPTYRGFDSFMGYLAGTYKPLSHRHLC